MNNSPVYISRPRVWVATVGTANTNRDGTGTIAPLVVGGVNGSRIDFIRVQAAGTTTAGVVRLFMYTTSWVLLKEILVSAITPGTGTEAWSGTWQLDTTVPQVLAPYNKIGVSTHNAETFNIVAVGGDY